MYVVDERSVAGAIVARASARTAVARTSFRSDPPRGQPAGPVFGGDPGAGSLRLGGVTPGASPPGP
jgi:hypothetical protein